MKPLLAVVMFLVPTVAPTVARADTSEAITILSSRLLQNWPRAQELHVACAEPREGPWCWARFWIGERERFEMVMCRSRFFPWHSPTNCISTGMWAP